MKPKLAIISRCSPTGWPRGEVHGTLDGTRTLCGIDTAKGNWITSALKFNDSITCTKCKEYQDETPKQ